MNEQEAIEILRKYPPGFPLSGEVIVEVYEAKGFLEAHNAAKEREKALREELASKAHLLGKTIDELEFRRAENAALREEIERYRYIDSHGWKDKIDGLEADNARLRAVVERYREALKEINTGVGDAADLIAAKALAEAERVTKETK